MCFKKLPDYYCKCSFHSASFLDCLYTFTGSSRLFYTACLLKKVFCFTSECLTSFLDCFRYFVHIYNSFEDISVPLQSYFVWIQMF